MDVYGIILWDRNLPKHASIITIIIMNSMLIYGKREWDSHITLPTTNIYWWIELWVIRQ